MRRVAIVTAVFVCLCAATAAKPKVPRCDTKVIYLGTNGLIWTIDGMPMPSHSGFEARLRRLASPTTGFRFVRSVGANRDRLLAAIAHAQGHLASPCSGLPGKR